jgi:hypothetical protein
MRRCGSVVPLLVSLIAFAALTPRNARAQDSSLAGTFRVASDQTTVQIPEWGSDCGPRPASHTGSSGREVTVTLDGSNLVIADGRRRLRTDGCWSDNPRVQRSSVSRSGNRWTVQCQTPPDDYQRESGVYAITAETARITMRDTTEYSWQLRGSSCRATATRTVSYDRVSPAPAQQTTPVVVADAAAPTPTRPPPVNRCATPGAPVRLELTPARRALAPGGRSCFRARLLDANQCEVSATGTPVSWQMTRSGAAGGAEASMEGGCVRVPANSPRTEYAVTATAGGLSARAVAAVVSAEELHLLIAQQIEEEPSDAGVLAMGTVSGAGVGAVVVNVETPASHGGEGSSLPLWLLLGGGVLLAAGAGVLLTRRRGAVAPPRDSRSSLDDVSEPSSAPTRVRREAVPIPVRERAEAPVARPDPVPPTEPRPLVKRCPGCDARFTAEMAFCPEDGKSLVDVVAGPPAPIAPAAAAPPAPPCPACGKPVEGGARFCPEDGTALGADPTPLSCPKCQKRYALGTLFCGEDGSALTNG